MTDTTETHETRTGSPTATATRTLPLSVALYTTVGPAEDAISRLLAAGIRGEQISVVCPPGITTGFTEVEHHDPAGTTAGQGATVGGAFGALLGGALVAGVAVTAGLGGPLVAGPVLAGMAGGAVGGGLIGAMTSRGIEPDVVDYYREAVSGGQILVAAEASTYGERGRIEEALAAAGAEPVTLPA